MAASTHNGGAFHHIMPVVVTVGTEVHTAGDTRKWLLLSVADTTLCALLL